MSLQLIKINEKNKIKFKKSKLPITMLVINVNKQRTTIKWETLEISLSKLETKGTFQAKMDTLQDRNGMDLTEAGDIKKRWQEYIK